MRFVITGEWNRNRLLQTIVVLYALYVALLWLTNALLYFHDMGLTPASVVAHYLGDAEQFRAPRSYSGMLELAHFHLFAMGMLLLVLTHLMLFIRASAFVKALLVTVPFLAGLLSEASGWLVLFVSPQFALLKIGAFLLLQASLAALILCALRSVFGSAQAAHYTGGGVERGAEAGAGPP